MCASFRNYTQTVGRNGGQLVFKKTVGRNLSFQKYNPLHNKRLLSKAGEAIRTPDIHVGNVITHAHSESESPIIGDIQPAVAKTVATNVQDEVLVQLIENWSSLPEHIKLAIQALVNAGGV